MPVSIPEPKSGPVHQTETLRDVVVSGAKGSNSSHMPGTARLLQITTREEPSGYPRAVAYLLRIEITSAAVLRGKLVNQFEVGEGRFYPRISRALWPLAA